MLALIEIKKGGLLAEVAENTSFALPDGSIVAPARDGWENGGYRLATVVTPRPAEAAAVIATAVEMVDGAPTTVYTYAPAPTLAELRATRLAALADRRWRVETGGVTVAGAPVRTDAASQARITSAVSLFQNDQGMAAIDWEALPGTWVTLDRAAMKAIGIAVGRHVQACFSHARELSQQIAAAPDRAALDAIDFETGWPD